MISAPRAHMRDCCRSYSNNISVLRPSNSYFHALMRTRCPLLLMMATNAGEDGVLFVSFHGGTSNPWYDHFLTLLIGFFASLTLLSFQLKVMNSFTLSGDMLRNRTLQCHGWVCISTLWNICVTSSFNISITLNRWYTISVSTFCFHK